MTPDATRRQAAVLYRALGMGEVTPDDPRGFSSCAGGVAACSALLPFAR